MTITGRLGMGYAALGSVSVLAVLWLWHHEFVEEAARFAARGVGDLHEDTAAELFTLCFLGLIPVLLGLGWWWTRRVLAPLGALTRAAEQLGPTNLSLPLPRSNNDDEVDRLAAVLTSMTMRLDASFQQTREFTLHASHELKTPLTVMRAQLETVLHESGSRPGGRSEWLESLLDEVQRLAEIVDSLTLLTRADAGLVALEREPVPFGQLVQEAFENALVMAQPQHVEVGLDECAEATLMGDRHRLRQLLLILVDNAVKYNRPGGEIRISHRTQGGIAELRITNDSAGMDPDTRRLFGRFVRGENAIGRADGCGLGLTIAQWIVHAHGGSIELREAAEKATALVRMPLAHAERLARADALAQA